MTSQAGQLSYCVKRHASRLALASSPSSRLRLPTEDTLTSQSSCNQQPIASLKQQQTKNSQISPSDDQPPPSKQATSEWSTSNNCQQLEQLARQEANDMTFFGFSGEPSVISSMGEMQQKNERDEKASASFLGHPREPATAASSHNMNTSTTNQHLGLLLFSMIIAICGSLKCLLLSNNDHQSRRIKSTRKQSTYYLLAPLLLLALWPQQPATRTNTRLLVQAQSYAPAWASPPLEQEIFLLNLEDGYFGCQVNKSQDFLQLFELSRLCDGTNECFLGSDELPAKLKCNPRDRCAMAPAGAAALAARTSSTNNQLTSSDYVPCVNGVCLDGLCYCNDGFGGKSCDVPDENECKYRPCDVFAHCTNTMGSYYCSCFPGYDGDGMHCQDINECEIPSLAALCSDNSECCNLPGHFICKCKPGYQQAGSSQSLLSGAPSGNNSVSCTDIDECLDERACGKGALCENLPGSFRCSCPAGFTGDPSVECIDMDECRNEPCGAGAQCTNIPGGYRCSCAQGFERNPFYPANLLGSHTSLDSTAPATSLTSTTAMAPTTAPPGGQDLQLANNNSALVACLDINECLAPSKTGAPICSQNAQCHNTPGGYFCQCPPGFSGNPKLACQDIDECAAHVCGPNTNCKNTPGSFKCECKPGFVGNAFSSEGCQDDDECQRKDACGANAHCFNSMGSYNCMCPVGFTGDPYTKCSDIDECITLSPCGPGARCLNTAGSFKCACPDKYMARGTPEMGCERAAVDVGCANEFDCPQNAQCLNETCHCKLGYQIKGVDCVDVDECLLSQPLQTIPLGSLQAAAGPAPPGGGKFSSLKPFNKLGRSSQAFNIQQQQLINNSLTAICGLEATCHNTDGSYRCECKRGYAKLDPLSPVSKCHDIDECATEPDDPQGACGPNSKCFNTEGAFKCECLDGFIHIDPQDTSKGCKSLCDGVNCGQHATCVAGKQEAACMCNAGFSYDPNNIRLGCVDINECDLNYGPAGLCGLRAICTNLPGSYKCSCPSGFTGNATLFCEDVNECDRRFGVFGQCGEMAICNNTVGSYTCSCGPGFTGDPKTKCSDIDECSPRYGASGRCGLNAQCTNLPGKFTCHCPPGYSGDPNVRCNLDLAPCSSSSDCPNQNQVCQTGRCVCPYAAPPGGADGQMTTNSPLYDSVNECQSPCERTECGPQATCRLDNDLQPVCVCNAGYMAPGDGRSGCIDINECIQGMSALSGMTPLNALSAAAPLAQATGALAHNGSHPCGRNALCRNKPGTFDCVCPPNYSGSPYEACHPVEMAPPMNLQQQTKEQASPGQQPINTKPVNYQQEPRTSSCSEACPRGHLCVEGQCMKAASELLACRGDLDCRHDEACEYLQQPGSLLSSFQCVHVCELHQCGANARCLGAQHKPICQCNSTQFAGDPYDRLVGCQPVSTQYDTPTTTTTSITTTTTTGLAGGQQMTTTTMSNVPTTMTTTSGGGGGTTNMDQFGQPAVQSMSTPTGDGMPATAFEFGSPPAGAMMTPPAMLDVNIQHREPNQTTMMTYDTIKQTNRPGTDRPLVMQSEVMTTPTLNQPMNQQQQQQNSRQRQRPAPATTTTPTMMTTAVTTSPTPTNADFGQKLNNKIQQQQGTNSNQRINERLGMTANNEANYSRPLMTCASDLDCPGNLFCLPTPESLSLRGALKYCGCPQGYKRDHDYCFVQRVACNSNALCRAREECMLTGSTGDLSGICVCPRGFKLVSTSNSANQNSQQQFNVCMDRDECAEGNACAQGAICQNKIGSYECICPPGTQGDGYSRACEPTRSSQQQQQHHDTMNQNKQQQQQHAECQTSADCSNDRECSSYMGKCVSPCHVCGPRALCTASNHAAICLCPPRFVGNPLDQVFGCQESSGGLSQPATTASPPTTPATTSQTNSPNGQMSFNPQNPLSNSNQQRAPMDIQGVPVTTLLPQTQSQSQQTQLVHATTMSPTHHGSQPTTTSAPPGATGSPTNTELSTAVTQQQAASSGGPVSTESVEFRTIPPSELFVMCLADGIQVELQLGGFDGIIYVKGHSQDPKCRKLVMSSSASEFVDFKVQFGHCDLIHRDGEASFVLVIQKHPKLVTYRARAYHVKCVYNTGERTVTLGFNVSMITTSGTIANTGPPPTCLMSITAVDGREVSSAEIGQDLLLRVDVQPDSIYGGFARSCEAKTMDDEGEYQYEVTDANGCATDPSIFSDWKYDTNRKSLVARFNAFKFPSSNNLRFQCNIRVCFGSCPPVNCNGIDSYGRRRRRRRDVGADNSTRLLDQDDDQDQETADELVVSDAFKEGALREEVMVQSNAILTFDKKAGPAAAQHRQARPGEQQLKLVEDVEFVCLPRLGLFMSALLCLLVALLAFAVAISCWFFKRKREARERVGVSRGGPLAHPSNFPNPAQRHLAFKQQQQQQQQQQQLQSSRSTLSSRSSLFAV